MTKGNGNKTSYYQTRPIKTVYDIFGNVLEDTISDMRPLSYYWPGPIIRHRVKWEKIYSRGSEKIF